jgi:hypothetical protein
VVAEAAELELQMPEIQQAEKLGERRLLVVAQVQLDAQQPELAVLRVAVSAVAVVAHSPAALDNKAALARPVKLLLLTRQTNTGEPTARQVELGRQLIGIPVLPTQRAGLAGLQETMQSSPPIPR